MSLSPNLVVMHCPVCDRAILASSTQCQFCGAAVTPTALPSDLQPAVRPVVDSALPPTWQQVCYVVMAYLWIAAGALIALNGLSAGATLALPFAAIPVLLGLGLLKQNWLAQTIGKVGCGINAVYAAYYLIAGPAIQSSGRSFSFGLYLAQLALDAFQFYILWYMSD